MWKPSENEHHFELNSIVHILRGSYYGVRLDVLFRLPLLDGADEEPPGGGGRHRRVLWIQGVRKFEIIAC